MAALLAGTGAVVTAPSSASAATPVLFKDDFTDGDSAGWCTSKGEWAVVDNLPSKDFTSLVFRQSATATARAVAGQSTWDDYQVSAAIHPPTFANKQSSVGIQARVQRDGSHYYLNARANDTLELGKVVHGRNTVLATTSYQTNVSSDIGLPFVKLTLVVMGSTLVGRADNETLLMATDTRLRTGRIALATNEAAGAFDDVSVTSYGAAGPDTQAPLSPSTPKIVDFTGTTATITWSPTVDNVGVVDYVLYRIEDFPYSSAEEVGTYSGTGPVTVPFSQTAFTIEFGVGARDAAGNISWSGTVSMHQPPSFPKTGNDTIPPGKPGTPQYGGRTADGKTIVTWAPAVDNIGVVEYHVFVNYGGRRIKVMAKVQTTSAEFEVSDDNVSMWVVAYDASWNSTSSGSVQWHNGF